MSDIRIVLALLAGLGLGVLAGWFAGRAQLERQLEPELYGALLGREMEKSGLCANSLKLIEDGRTDTLTQLLEANLGWSIREADRLCDKGARIDMAIPNLREGLRRGADYFRAKDPESELVTVAERVLDRLE